MAGNLVAGRVIFFTLFLLVPGCFFVAEVIFLDSIGKEVESLRG